MTATEYAALKIAARKQGGMQLQVLGGAEVTVTDGRVQMVIRDARSGNTAMRRFPEAEATAERVASEVKGMLVELLGRGRGTRSRIKAERAAN